MNKKNILEWIICIFIAVVLALLFRYFIGTPTIVKMNSMYPTLESNQRLWLNRWGRTTKTLPKRGEIITFEKPTKIKYTYQEIGKDSYIKRVIALPGEHVEIKDGKVYINTQELNETYLQNGIATSVEGPGFDDFIVPENCIFAMGDNRNNSTDCRAFGCIPLENIESTVAIRIWPLNLFGKVK